LLYYAFGGLILLAGVRQGIWPVKVLLNLKVQEETFEEPQTNAVKPGK